jgi:hypothetical protein
VSDRKFPNVKADAPSVPADSFAAIDPTKVAIRTISSSEDRIIPWQVQCYHEWQPYWSNEQKAGLRKSLGYAFVYKENVVTHFNDLAPDEVRISTSGWVTDGAGRVKTPDGLYLMLIPRRLWDARQDAKGKRAKAELLEKTLGNPEVEQAHLAKKAPAALDEIRKGTFLSGDTPEVD